MPINGRLRIKSMAFPTYMLMTVPQKQIRVLRDEQWPWLNPENHERAQENCDH